MIRLPAEWEPQAALMLTWPHAATDWAEHLPEVERLYAELVALVGHYQPLLIVCRDSARRAAIAARLGRAAPVILALAPSNDSWTRDHGPLVVVDDAGRARLVDFRFNGWGGKFPAGLDDRISARLHAAGHFDAADLVSSDLVLEGGAIECDGQGCLLMTRRTLIDPARNPGWSQADIERELRERLGIDRCLWLEHGWLSGDDTDGHIDTLARFADAGTICYLRCADPADPDYPALEAMGAELRALRRRDGAPYRLIELPHPAPIVDRAGRRLPASYANFIVLNGAVIAPVYADAADDAALRALAEAFPNRAIHPLDARPLLRQGGSLHCISMQLPAALPLGG